MKPNTSIVRVTCRWDDQPGAVPGWYCQSYDADGFVDDSQKVWWPVDVDDYSHDQRSELVTALQEAFPNATIVQEDRT